MKSADSLWLPSSVLYLTAFLDTRECARTGLGFHARFHPYPVPQCVKVGHTTGVYNPYSFRIVMWVLLHPTQSFPQGKYSILFPTIAILKLDDPTAQVRFKITSMIFITNHTSD